MKIFSKNVGIPFIVLSFGIPDEPPCYVRQCLSRGNAFLNWSDMSRGKFTAYVYLGMHCNTQLLIFRFSSLHNT